MRILLRIPFCLLLSFTSTFQLSAQNWEKEFEKNGITIFTKASKFSKIKDTKAVMQLTSSPEKVISKLMDFKNFPSWIPYCTSNTVLMKQSDSEYLYHLILNIPIIKKRDVIVHFKLRKISKNLWIIDLKNKDKVLPLDDRYLRMPFYSGKYILMVTETNSVKLTLENGYDPGGIIPSFIVNAAITETPFNMFENLRNLIQK